MHTDRAVTAAFAEIRRVDALLSIHREDSELAIVNARAAQFPVTLSPELFALLQQAGDLCVKTEGAFDFTIRPIADLWGFIWKEYRLPTTNELAAVLPRVDYRFIDLNASTRQVRFTRPGVSIDPGGFGKGYAVDCAIRVLREHGVTNALVRAGGDLRVIGAPPGKNAWTVQIEDPQKTGQRTEIELRDAAISTSGNYENFFVVNGTRYAHVLDPRTGMPVQNIAACSIIAPTCFESDMWATALMVLGPDDSQRRFGNHVRMRFVISTNGSDFIVRERNFPPVRAAR